MQSRPTMPARPLLVLFLAASPLTSQAQTPADSGAGLLEAGRHALEGQTGELLSQALELSRHAAIWFRKARRPRDEAEARRQIGLAHLRLGAPDSAFAQLNQARALASGDTAGVLQIEIASALGEAYVQTSEYQAALDRYREAYRLSQLKKATAQAAQSLNSIGLAHYYLGNVDSARVIFALAYQAARELRDTSLMGNALGNLGAVIDDVGLPDSALNLYRGSMALSRKVNDMKNVVGMISNIGLVYHNQGAFDSARVYYQRALATLTQAGLEAPAEKGNLTINLGALERATGRPAAALEYYREALGIFRAVGNREGAAVIVDNIGVVYLELERFDSALANAQAAADTFRAIQSPGGLRVALQNVASVYQALEKPDSAAIHYTAALELAKSLKDSAGQAYALAGLALIDRARGQFDSGLVHAWRAHEIAVGLGMADVASDLTNIGVLHEEAGRLDSAKVYYLRAIRKAKETKSPQTQRFAFENLGLLYHRGPRPDLRRGIAYYDSAAAIISRFRSQAGSDINRLSFSEGAKGLFGEWALAWLGRTGFPPRERALASLAAAERGRSQGLLDLIRGNKSGVRPGRNLAREGAAVVGELRAPALSYYVTKDTLLIWLVTASGAVQVAQQPIARDTLTQLVSKLSTSLRAKAADWVEPARALAVVLLPVEIVSRLPDRGELVIVPHGPLALVPFAVLPAGAKETPLGAERSIRYSPSLEILRRVANRPDRKAAVGREPSLVVGNPTMPSFIDPAGIDIDLSPLPHTRVEAESVAARIGTEALIGARATEAEVARQMPGAVVIHLATHGYAYSSDARTRESFVALAAGREGETEYDGHLTVGEVLDEKTPLTAELVVLSACQTGLGNLKQAEGTIGLQRAFLAKGARSVLVSLWSVPDEATSLLMQRFYAYWLGDDKPSKAEALRRAQADVRKDHPHPWYWAAFQLVGAP